MESNIAAGDKPQTYMGFILFLHVLLTALSFSLGRETSEN